MLSMHNSMIAAGKFCIEYDDLCHDGLKSSKL